MRIVTQVRLVGVVFVGIAVSACSPSVRLFPLRDPTWRDADTSPVSAACHAEPTPKDPRHVSCAPAIWVSPLMWDGVDNMVFRPLAESTGIVTSGESVDVNSLDEVPDSSWFTNRVGSHPMSVDEIRRGACDPSLLLDAAGAADGAWLIDHGKTEGSTSGFRMTVPGKGKFLVKLEPADQPERPSAGSKIGSVVYHAAGYSTTCEQILFVRRSVFTLKPGLRYRDGNFGAEAPFDEKALDKILAAVPKRGALLRIQASAWLPGYAIGPFIYEGTRSDDPNDVVPHEDRRELRGLRVLNSWIDRFDARSENTFDTWLTDGKGAPDGSPGHVVHNHLDTSECLGSEWDWNQISRRLGYSYLLDWRDIASDFVTLGIPTRTWDTIQRAPGHEIFGYFNAADFVPDQWKMEYPNAAFSRMTERDGAWMARILARFTPEMVHALALLADLSAPSNTTYLESVLVGRLDKILERYLTRLSPVADVRMDTSDRLCGVDLAELRGLREPQRFHYAARVAGGNPLQVMRQSGAGICVALPHVAADGGAPDDARERYVRVVVEDGVARGALVAHLYDLGPTRGYRLVGLERPDP